MLNYYGPISLIEVEETNESFDTVTCCTSAVGRFCILLACFIHFIYYSVIVFPPLYLVKSIDQIRFVVTWILNVSVTYAMKHVVQFVICFPMVLWFAGKRRAAGFSNDNCTNWHTSKNGGFQEQYRTTPDDWDSGHTGSTLCTSIFCMLPFMRL